MIGRMGEIEVLGRKYGKQGLRKLLEGLGRGC